MAGRDWSSRGSALDECIERLLSLLRGETIDFNGNECYLHHRPDSSLQKILAVGGSSRAAARRAARFDLPFWPAIDAAEIRDTYASACEENGVDQYYIDSRFNGSIHA